MKPVQFKRAALIGLGLALLFFIAPGFARADVTGEVRAAGTQVPMAYLPLLMKDLCGTGTTPPADWLGYVNYQRGLACLPPLTENAAYSDGDQKHARYMVRNDVIDHTESMVMPWYTPEGAAAGFASNIMGAYCSGSISLTDQQAIDFWMRGPFHAVAILDPKLLQTGFGSFREVGDNTCADVQMAAALDVNRGLGNVPSSVTFPIKWPGEGMTVSLRSFGGNELPNPLSSCSGYGPPTGLPIILQLGIGNTNPSGTTGTFKQGSSTLPSCVFDETNYTDPTYQDLGRSILGARDAIVLIPRDPLTPGLTYTVSITTNGQTYAWTFSVSLSATALELGPEALIR